MGALRISSTCKEPKVSVPVLSTMSDVVSASSSRKAEPRINIPWRAATAIPATAVAGAASASAHGQAATITASMACASLLHEPGDCRDQQHQNQIPIRVALEQPRDRRLGALGALHERDDLAQGRLPAGTGDLDFEQAVEIDRAAEYLGADVDFQRHGFTGDRRRIETRTAFDDAAVGGDSIAGAHLR